MNNRHGYKNSTKILPVKNWRNIAKLLTISIFITAFGVASPKAAHAFRSTVDACAIKPDCAAALGLKLAPVVSNVVKGTVVVTGVCSLSSEPCSIPRYYWNAELNQQAQELAKQKYCITNPNDTVCLPPFYGGQGDRIAYRVEFDFYTKYIYYEHHYGQPAEYAFERKIGAEVWGPVVNITTPTHDNYYTGYWIYSKGNTSNSPSSNTLGTGGWLIYGYWVRAEPRNIVITRVDGQPDTGGNPPSLAWKDWPQEKRNEAVKLISPSAWQVLIKSMPKGEDLKPGEIIKGLITIVVQVAKDNPTTTKDESLQPKTVPGLYKVPLASDADVYSRLTPAQKKRVDKLVKEGRLTKKQVNADGKIEPEKKCLYFELPIHLGGNTQHNNYATWVTGSDGDFFMMEPDKGDYAFYDGEVKANGAANIYRASNGQIYHIASEKTLAEVKTGGSVWISVLNDQIAQFSDNEWGETIHTLRELKYQTEVGISCRRRNFLSFSNRKAARAAQLVFANKGTLPGVEHLIDRLKERKLQGKESASDIDIALQMLRPHSTLNFLVVRKAIHYIPDAP